MTKSSLFVRLFTAVENVASVYLVAAILFAMWIFVSLEVISRLTFNHSYIGLTEFVTASLLLTAFLSLSNVQREDSHIKMTFLVEKFSGKRAASIIQIANTLISVIAIGIACYMALAYALEALQIE